MCNVGVMIHCVMENSFHYTLHTQHYTENSIKPYNATMKQRGFNPRARWDRHIPETERCPQDNSSELNTRIEVLVWFRNGKVQPRLFIWDNKKYRIKNINYNWQERRGRELISLFSVSSGFDLYQISFNNTSYYWRLDKIIE